MGRQTDREDRPQGGGERLARVRRIGGYIRQLAVAGALIAVGLSLGIIVGTLSDLPDLLYLRMQEPGQVVELDFEPLQDADLEAFAGLHGEGGAGSPAPGAVPLPAPPSDAGATLAATPAATPPPVSSAPASLRAAESTAARTRGAERLIEEMARRQSAESHAPGAVVQVASYRDRRAADALTARLGRQGYAAYVSTLSRGGERRYRVRVRPGGGLDQDTIAADLAQRGFSVWVTRE